MLKRSTGAPGKATGTRLCAKRKNWDLSSARCSPTGSDILQRRFQGSARPDNEKGSDTPVAYAAAPVEQFGGRAPQNAAGHGHDRPRSSALDRVLFARPYVLIAADNSSPRRVDELAEAHEAVRRGEVASAAGRLRPGVLGVDIDPADVGADAVLGDVVAERFATWCTANRVPYLVRESGRPGGRHVVAVTSTPTVAEQWARLCAELESQYEVPVTDRAGMALRLLSAPHRTGLPAPVLGGTLTPSAAQEVIDGLPVTESTSGHCAPRPRRRQPARERRTGERDRTRSAREFGSACAMVRAGYTAAQAWRRQAQPGSKALERGELNWRKYVWLPAVTTVAAEEDVTEDEGWRRAQVACQVRCRQLGREGWRMAVWQPACEDAGRDRPRRYRVDDDDAENPQRAAEIDWTSRGLVAAAEDLLAARGVDARRRRSASTLLHTLAPVLVGDRAGSISHRALAERARLDPKTVRAALAVVVDAGVLTIARTYAGGNADCHQYGIGPAARSYVSAARTSSSPTSCSTPSPHPAGRANPSRLRQTHQDDRRTWRLRCELSTSTEATGENYRTSQHPAAKTLRSIRYQRQWWQSLPDAEQEARRAARRQVLRTLDTADVWTWLDWLVQRENIRMAADATAGGTGGTEEHRTLATAPVTVHRGLRDPNWRTGGTASTPSPTQPLPFAA